MNHTKPLLPFLVSTGPMPHMRSASKPLARRNESPASLSRCLRPATRGSACSVRGSTADLLPSASSSTKGPWSPPCGSMTFWGSFPSIRLRWPGTAMPLTTDEGVIAPHALLVQTLVSQLRVTLHAVENFDATIAQRTKSHADFSLFQALPGAGPVFASRLLVA